MPKVISSFETQNLYATWLSSFEWSHYATFTTGYEMTLPTARRLMGAYHSNIKRAGSSPFFWVAEKFEVKDGYHTHALLKAPQAWHYKNLIDIWQKVSGGKKKGKWHRLDLQDYDSNLGARHYVSKYITKRCADFDFLFS
jgi:hypothetical protein